MRTPVESENEQQTVVSSTEKRTLWKAGLFFVFVLLLTEVNEPVRSSLKALVFPDIPLWLDHIFFLLTFKLVVLGLMACRLLSREEIRLRAPAKKEYWLVGFLSGIPLFFLALLALNISGEHLRWTWQPDTLDIFANLFSNFYEELLYRGIILAFLTKYLGSHNQAAMVSALLFCHGHLRYPVPMLFMTFAVSVFWAWLSHRSKSLLPAYCSHVVVDTLAAFLK